MVQSSNSSDEEISVFMEPNGFITVFTQAHHCPCPEPIESVPHTLTFYLKHILILSSHTLVRLSSGLSLLRFSD